MIILSLKNTSPQRQAEHFSLQHVRMSMSHYCSSFVWWKHTSQNSWQNVMCSNSIYNWIQEFAHWWGRFRTCLWRRDIPSLLPGTSCFEDFCRAAEAEARTPPDEWDAFVEDALTTDSIFPSSLTSRVRMSSSKTAIVLLRSAACERQNKNNLKTDPFFSLMSIRDFVIAYHNQPWRFPAALRVHSGSPPSGPWRTAGWAPESARAARRCFDGEAAAQCSAEAWVPRPGRTAAAAHSASETCSSAGVHPAWYRPLQREGRGGPGLKVCSFLRGFLFIGWFVC